MTTSTTELNTRDVHGSIPMHIDSSDEEDEHEESGSDDNDDGYSALFVFFSSLSALHIFYPSTV